MKKNYIVLTAVLAILYVSLSSDIDGPAHHGHGNITGAPSGTVGHCETSSCHGGNNAGNIVLLQVLDSSSMTPVTTYHAGQTYLVQLTGDATAISASLPGFGFQVSCVLGTRAQAGTFVVPSALSSSIHTYPTGPTTVIEHSTRLAPVTSGINKYSISFYWKAPVVFSDSVMFYSVLNAVNGDGGDGGDYPDAAPEVTLHEDPADAVASLTLSADDISVFPNPCHGSATISYSLHSAAQVSISISDMSGRMVQIISEDQFQLPGAYRIPINLQAPGPYFIHITTGNYTAIQKIVRL